jgi:hypothetical protein
LDQIINYCIHRKTISPIHYFNTILIIGLYQNYSKLELLNRHLKQLNPPNIEDVYVKEILIFLLAVHQNVYVLKNKEGARSILNHEILSLTHLEFMNPHYIKLSYVCVLSICTFCIDFGLYEEAQKLMYMIKQLYSEYSSEETYNQRFLLLQALYALEVQDFEDFERYSLKFIKKTAQSSNQDIQLYNQALIAFFKVILKEGTSLKTYQNLVQALQQIPSNRYKYHSFILFNFKTWAQKKIETYL